MPVLPSASPGVALGAVNRAHPLNRGLVGWWLVLPGQTQGSRWRNLLPNHQGTRSAGVVWSGSRNRLGGQGSLGFNGATTFVSVPSHAIFSPTTTGQLSVTAWVSTSLVAATYSLVNKGTAGAYEWDMYLNGAVLSVSTFNPAGAAFFLTVGGALLSVGQWAFVGFTLRISPASLQLYFNGHPDVTDTTSDGGVMAAGAAPLQFGDRADGALGLTGFLDDIRIYNRVLSASEMRQLYVLSSGSYQGLLSHPRSLAMRAAAAPTFKPAWAQYHNIGQGFPGGSI